MRAIIEQTTQQALAFIQVLVSPQWVRDRPRGLPPKEQQGREPSQGQMVTGSRERIHSCSSGNQLDVRTFACSITKSGSFVQQGARPVLARMPHHKECRSTNTLLQPGIRIRRSYDVPVSLLLSLVHVCHISERNVNTLWPLNTCSALSGFANRPARTSHQESSTQQTDESSHRHIGAPALVQRGGGSLPSHGACGRPHAIYNIIGALSPSE